MILDWSMNWQVQPSIVLGLGAFGWSPGAIVFGGGHGWVQVFSASNAKRGGG